MKGNSGIVSFARVSYIVLDDVFGGLFQLPRFVVAQWYRIHHIRAILVDPLPDGLRVNRWPVRYIAILLNQCGARATPRLT